MARANRHFIPGHIWHLTHRCHKREFLLKFARDRRRWVRLLFSARQRYGLSILNYVATKNHVHLVVADNGDPSAISRTMQYAAGRTAYEYNQRKNRKGAFWEDRYHATAIESGHHLRQCLVYVDLNMVRAGAVAHPSQWQWGGYHEIQNPKTRCRLIDHHRLQKLLDMPAHDDLAEAHAHWVRSKLTAGTVRETHFSQSLAVGSEAYVRGVQKALGIRAAGRRIRDLASVSDDGCQLREPESVYGHIGLAGQQPADAVVWTSEGGRLLPWRGGSA